MDEEQWYIESEWDIGLPYKKTYPSSFDAWQEAKRAFNLQEWDDELTWDEAVSQGFISVAKVWE